MDMNKDETLPFVTQKNTDPTSSHLPKTSLVPISRRNVYHQHQPSATGFSYYPDQQQSHRHASCWEYCSAYLSLVCYYHPWFCSFLAIITGLCLMLAMMNALFNPMQTYGIIAHNHLNIRSKFDLSMKDIDHWCLGGGNDNCACEDPLHPIPQFNRRAWMRAFSANKQLVAEFNDDLHQKDIDVAFVGESIVEEMSGRWLGDYVKPLGRLKKGFDSKFHKDSSSGRLEGVALGIAGDTAPNVLYRLTHGEMPDYFRPKVWWLVIGMNELARTRCSEEVTLIGILRVVEEILDQRPEAQVVINSLLPMEYTRGGKLALAHDYQDSLNEMGNTAAERVWEHQAEKQTDDSKEGWRYRRLRKQPSSRSDTGDRETEDITAEENRLESKIRKKEGKRRKGHLNAKLNPNVIRKRTSLLRKGPPLWASIHIINTQLKRFAQDHPRVEFFDATPVFTSVTDKTNTMRIKSSLLSARGHPTPLGFSVWEEAIAYRLLDILDKISDNPSVKNDTDYFQTSHAFGFDPNDDDTYPYFEMMTDDLYGNSSGDQYIKDESDASASELHDPGRDVPPDSEGEPVEKPPHEPITTDEGSAPIESNSQESESSGTQDEVSSNGNGNEEPQEPETNPEESDEVSSNGNGNEEPQEPESNPEEPSVDAESKRNHENPVVVADESPASNQTQSTEDELVTENENPPAGIDSASFQDVVTLPEIEMVVPPKISESPLSASEEKLEYPANETKLEANNPAEDADESPTSGNSQSKEDESVTENAIPPTESESASRKDVAPSNETELEVPESDPKI